MGNDTFTCRDESLMSLGTGREGPQSQLFILMVSSCGVGFAFAGVPISECEEDQLPGSRFIFSSSFW